MGCHLQSHYAPLTNSGNASDILWEGWSCACAKDGEQWQDKDCLDWHDPRQKPGKLHTHTSRSSKRKVLLDFLLYSGGFTHCNLLYLSLSHFYCLTLVIVSREPHFACISWDSPEIKNLPLHVLYYVIVPFCEKLN